MTTAELDPPVWRYRPALDGVRALAVAAVVAFHSRPSLFSGGFIGVDVFFVLSGYLITGMLCVEHARRARPTVSSTDLDSAARRVLGGIDLRGFWARRIRRLVPAVVVLVAVCAVAAWATDSASLRGLVDSIGALTWTTNWADRWLRLSSYGELDHRTLLDHLWSLAIEEQFYLVWPLVLVGLLRWVRSAPVRLGAVLVLGAASVAAMAFIDPADAYTRTDARAFELLAGAAVALVGRDLPARWRTPAVVVSAGVLTSLCFTAGPLDSWMYPWGFLAAAGAAAFGVASLVAPPGWAERLFAHPVLVGIGRRSYGIYLWHIPVLNVLSVGRVPLPGPLIWSLRAVVLAALVELSYRFVESPFRTGSIGFSPPVVIGAIALVALSMVPLVQGARRDLDGRWESTSPLPARAAGQPKVLLVGDDIAGLLAFGLASRDDLAVWNLFDLRCGLVADVGRRVGERTETATAWCRHWSTRWGAAVRRFDPDVVVLGAGAIDSLALVRNGAVLEGRELDAAYAAAAAAQLEALRTAERIVVVEVADPSKLVPLGERPMAERARSWSAYNRAVRAAVADDPRVSVLSVTGDVTATDLATEVGRRLDVP
ncbi:MAG TPA: acyltransferase [Microthrixaceae bacterium]|nr:acyltransferase [Microthrixaceae bacterium]HMT24739.1 acyltransferase [Microthrixaceae bacterium]HMT62397.1 acyltransferase [Microthrixaceae bacterium]